MRESQFNELRKHSSDTFPTIEVVDGIKKIRGRRGRVTRTGWNALYVEIDGKEHSVPYQKAEIVKANGKLDIQPVTDMSGREIGEGAWVVYSSTFGRYNHHLEIGKITRVLGSGSVRVRPYLRDGRKTEPNQWARNEDKLITNPSRCLKLPVEVPTLTMWILKDFEDIAPCTFWDSPEDEECDG